MRASGLLASVLSELGRNDEAVPLSQQGLEEHRRLLGPRHFQTLIQGNNHARLLGDLGRYDESLELFELTLGVWQEEYPELPSVLRTIRWNHGRILEQAGRREEAEAEFLQVLDLEAAAGPNPRPARGEVLERMASFYEDWGRREDANRCRAKLAVLEDAP